MGLKDAKAMHFAAEKYTNLRAVFQCKYLLGQRAIKYPAFKYSSAASGLHTHNVNAHVGILVWASELLSTSLSLLTSLPSSYL